MDGQQLCVVCSDLANGLHYGAITCRECNQFFQRGMTNHPSYLCDNEKNCVIKPRASNACRYCRYQKCLKAGMSQEAIQRGRTSNFHHTSHNQNLPVPKMEPHSHEKEQHLQTSAGLEKCYQFSRRIPRRVVPSVTYVTKSEASEAVVAISSGVEDKRSIIKEDSLGEDGSTVTAIIHDIPSASLIEIVDEIDDKASITKTESLAAVFVIFNEIDDKASITKTETQDSDTSKSVMSSTTNTRRGTDNDNSAEYLVLRTANIKQISTVERLPQDQSNSVSKTILFNCKLCDFQAFNNPQLQSHELWHKEHHQERNNAKPFRCPYCPCVVSTFADFRFHAQFHKRGVMMKYFKCASCTFRCDSEDIMGMHCVSDEKTEYEESGIDDDTVTYIEMVTFHMGRFACPMELCGESFQVVESLLQHCLYQHEGQLADKHLLDFYECPQPVSTSISKMPAEGVIEDTDNAVDRHLCESCGYEARCFSELYRHMTENHKTTCYTVAEDNATSESSETETTRSNPSTLDLSLTIAETRNNANNYLDNENEIPMLETDLTGSESKISNNSCANDVMENINLEINEVDSKSLGTKKSSCFQHAVPEDDLTCDLCRDLIDIENVMASRLKQHRRFHVNFSGSAFQCGYCSHLAYEKETIALHLASVHVDFQPKLLAVLMENGEVMSKEMVNMKGSRFYRPPVGDTTYELDNILEQMCSRPHSSTSGSTSENRGNDDHPLTHHDHIFCSKVVGLKLFRCNLCSFMSELGSSVRVHYLVEHRNHMPLLCGRCFKTVNVKSLRKHHFQHHAQHSLAVIRIVYGNNGTTYENTGNQPDLMRREFEVTEEVDATGRNDWHAATLNLCSVDVRENVLICKFCSFKSENLAEISQHVLPQHFRQCPLVCHYCHFGTVLISKMKIHMINHHSTLPFRIRRVLPIQPTEEEILLAKRTQRNRCDGIRKSLEALAGKKRRASSDKEDREDRVRQGASVLDEDPRLQKMYLCQYCEFVSCKSIHSVKHHIVCFHLNYRVHNCDYCTFGSRVLESMLNHLKKEHPTLPCSYTHVGAFKHAAQEYIEEMGNVTVVALFDFDGKAVRRLEHAQARLYCEYALQQNGYKIKGQNKKKTTNLESNKEAEGIEPSTSPMENEKENTKLRGPSLRRYVAPLNSCFRCKLCGEAYTTAKALKYHITRIHWKLYPIMCPLCGFGDFKRMKVDQHIMSAHPGSEVKPQIIPSFRHKELQQLVIVPEEPIKKRQMATSSYACALCSHTTHDHFIMRRHVMIHMKYEPFRCPHCDLSSVEKYQIKKHMEKVHKDTKGAPLTVKDMEKELQIENNISKTKTPGLQQRRATNKLEKSDGEISENEESVTEEERREESVPKERNPNHVPTEEHVPKSQKCPDCEFSATSVRYFYQHVNLMHKTYSETLETADFNEDNNPPSDNDVPLRHAETMTVNTQPKANFTKGAPYTKLNRQCKEARFASPIYSTNSFIDCQPQASNRRKITKSRVRASSPVESITSNSSFTASSSEASDRSSRRDSESSDRTIDDFSDASSVVSEKSSMGKQDLIMCCFACSYRTHAEINLLAHIQQHRDFGEKLECRFCEHVMKEYLEHEDHVKSHVRSRPYRCSRCNKCFKLHRKALDHCTRDHVGRRKARVEAVEIMDNIRNTLRRERKRQLETLHMHPKVFIKDYNVFNENCS